MKKFRSPLEKVKAISSQQRRLAQLELIRCLAEESQAEQDVQAAEAQLAASYEAADKLLRTPQTGALLQTLRCRLAADDESLVLAQEVLQAARDRVTSARDVARERQNREDAVSKLIEQQYTEFRRDVQRRQQAGMDESSAARWSPEQGLAEEVINHG